MNKRLLPVIAISLVAGIAIGQLDKILKIGGMAVIVDKFGGEMNKGLNKLTKHTDSARIKTKVVTILSVGIGKSSAIGAAQVMGPPEKVDLVRAVAQPEADLLGKQVRLKALIPVSDKDVTRGIKTVDGVGVSGIVDIKL